MWQQAIGLDAGVPADGVQAISACLADAHHPVDGPAFFCAWSSWLEILDHRCERPDVVAAAVLDCAGAFQPATASTGWRQHMRGAPVAPSVTAASELLAIVRTHPDEPPPDAMVLSDALLHFVGEVDNSDRLANQLVYFDSATEISLPPSEVIDTTDSIFYTPEARARLEARAQLNLARRRARAARDTKPASDAAIRPGCKGRR